jgi:HEAT repeat protein
VRVFADHASREAAAREQLSAALDDPDSDVRAAAFAALLGAGPEARALLLPRAAQASAAGDAAATALARQAPREALPALLAALASDGGSERAALREAVEVACQTGGPEALPLVREWSETNAQNVAARASLALALSRAQNTAPLAGELLAADVAHADRFEDRWRLVQTARALPSDAAVDGWLAALAKDDERWMLRAAAIAALAERKAAQRSDVAVAALGDSYPRVRAQAAGVLSSEPSAREPLTLHAMRDKWPLVRAAAIESLAAQPGNEEVLRKGVGDRSHQVRAAAVRALAAAHVRDAWPLVEQRLKSEGEWPEVAAEAIRFAANLCVREAGPQLQAALQRGIKPDAWEPDVDNALLAFDALMRLGGADAKAALDTANLPISPEVFKSAARTQQGKPAACAAER